jgi:hypothetical protein
MDSTSSFDLEENNIAGCPKRDNQLTGKRTVICFAAAKRANSQELACLSDGLNRFRRNFKIASWTVQFALKREVKHSFEILFGLAAENDLVLHW